MIVSIMCIKNTTRRTETKLDDIDPARAQSARNGEIELMSLNEASAFLGGMAITTIRKRIRARVFPFIKVGKRILIPRDKLREALDKLTVEASHDR